MIIHIALFAWKNDVDSERIRTAFDEVRSLKNKVPALADIRCGENFSQWSEGFTHAVTVLAESKESLEAYRMHPDHVKVAALIDSMASKALGVDFED